jgi:hypothetical protein
VTEPARGIHTHPSRKLGKRPPLPGRRALMLRDVLTGELPEHPPTADHLIGIAFGMYGNDRWGCCGPASIANLRRMTTYDLTGVTQAPTQADVTDLYVRSTTPPFNPLTGANDNGVYLQELLEAVHGGGIGGIRCVAFAKIDVHDHETLRAATAIFGGVLYGVDLQTSQQRQTDAGTWDYAPSTEWGGHAVPGGQYDADSLRVVTWAELVDMTDDFVTHQADEAWVVVWPEHFGSKAFLDGVDLSRLATAYERLTGQKLPVPAPTPTPEPPPFLPGLSDRARARMVSRARKRGLTQEQWVTWAVEEETK